MSGRITDGGSGVAKVPRPIGFPCGCSNLSISTFDSVCVCASISCVERDCVDFKIDAYVDVEFEV